MIVSLDGGELAIMDCYGGLQQCNYTCGGALWSELTSYEIRDIVECLITLGIMDIHLRDVFSLRQTTSYRVNYIKN